MFFIIRSHNPRPFLSGAVFVERNIFSAKAAGARNSSDPSVENSPTWYTLPLYVYSYATASTSSWFNAAFSDIYPNALFSVYSLLVSSRALSTFSKSVPPSIPEPLKFSSTELVSWILRKPEPWICEYNVFALLSGIDKSFPPQNVFCKCLFCSPKSVNATILRACS